MDHGLDRWREVLYLFKFFYLFWREPIKIVLDIAYCGLRKGGQRGAQMNIVL